MKRFNSVDITKSPKMSFSVIPVKTGIQGFKKFWTPAFAGVTTMGTFYESINLLRRLFARC